MGDRNRKSIILSFTQISNTPFLPSSPIASQNIRLHHRSKNICSITSTLLHLQQPLLFFKFHYLRFSLQLIMRLMILYWNVWILVSFRVLLGTVKMSSRTYNQWMETDPSMIQALCVDYESIPQDFYIPFYWLISKAKDKISYNDILICRFSFSLHLLFLQTIGITSSRLL